MPRCSSCLTLCNPMDCNPQGSSVHGISQARTLEWVAIFSSRASSWPKDQTTVSCISRQILYHWVTWEAHLFSTIQFSSVVSTIQFSWVQSLSRVQLFATKWTAACQASPPITNSQSLLKFMSIELVMPSTSVIFFSSCFQSFSASGSFPMSQLFASGGQSIGVSVSVSASVLPMNIQDWFPLGLSDLICLWSKGLSRVFSNTTVQKHQFFSAQLSL